MHRDAGPGEDPPARRPGRAVSLVVAVLLLIGGGTALTVGLLDQDADPRAPAAASTSSAASTAQPSTAQPSTAQPSTAQPSTAQPSTAAPSTAAPSTPVPAAAPVADPVSVRVPAIGVESGLITVGLDPDGALEVPQPGPDYDSAAWFREGPRPGETGPAVVEGHVDSAAGGPSVFYDLGRLAVGDRVEVDREDGTTVTFEVYETRLVPKDDFPRLDVYGNTPGPELRLITCGGAFDSSARSYTDNVVVFARQV